MGPYPRTSQGHRFILVVTNIFTRWVEAFPLRTSEAPRVVRLMEEEVFSRFGYSRRILSDNGPQFTGHTWAEASLRWGSELWTTPVYYPRANPTAQKVHGSTLVPAPTPGRAEVPPTDEANEPEGGRPPPTHESLAESVGGGTNEGPIEAVDRAEEDEDSSSHHASERETMDVDEQEDEVDPTGRRRSSQVAAEEAQRTPTAGAEEDEVDPTGRRRSSQGAAEEAHRMPTAGAECDESDTGWRYQLRPRAPVVYRDARPYAPRQRRKIM
ncbi:uncharacterized protein LOC117182530 [Belonocnema kinseyi]|uniref:uncharacterized protein LOC117182530 n=1 Tax=Belonocnema kinseyi TaxID=2817044 RepID=UPI00143DD5DD|nr:uncharacterized protein LOC117182530 [Belonocnema kinseyi]